jgi:hypothetical protein
MKKHPFLIFLLSVTVLIFGVLSFIQSQGFAQVLKGFVARHLPMDLGVQADFSDLSIGIFPPSVSIRNPKVTLISGNLINLPPGSTVSAKRIDLRFRLFQMFSGNIRVNEVAVVDGDIRLVLHAASDARKSTPSRFRPQINWDELFQIKAEAVALENSKIHLEVADSKFSADLVAERLKLAQWSGRGGLGYELRADLKDITSSIVQDWLPPTGISRLSAIAHVNAQGAEIDDLSTLLDGVDVHLSGQIRGNVLTDKALPFDSTVTLRADLASVSKLISKKQKLDAQGTVELEGKAHGNLAQLDHTARIEGRISGENLHYDNWVADQVTLDVSYSAPSGAPQAGHGGEIALSHGVILSKEIPRVGGHQPASGGKVEIDALRYVIGAKDPVSVPLKLENAHLQWLVAGDLKDVYPMDVRLSGAVSAVFTPGLPKQPWSLQTQVSLMTPVFQLDNQRIGLEKPMKRILRIKDLKIEGPITVNPNGASFTDVALSLPHTKLLVNGSVTGKTGFDLIGEGDASLADLAELAEVPISGNGSLSVHVHGPSSRTLIDFDSDLKDAHYLNLNLGSFNGRITWDDDPQFLLFDHVKALKGQTPYQVDGKLDLGKSESIDLGVDFQSGNIIDVTQIFDHFTTDLWWFPRTMSGPVHGTAKLSGGISMSELVIAADLTGTNWENLGERVKTISLKGGYDKGKYQITEMHGAKQTGKFTGKISFATDGKLDWDFKTQELQVNDLDHLARLDVPFRGKLQLESHGSGKESSIKSLTTGSLSELSVRGIGYAPSQFSLRTENGVLSCTGNALGGAASLELDYGLNPGTPSTLKAELRTLDFSPIILLLNPRLMQDSELGAALSGEAKLAFKSGQVERANGSFAVTQYKLAKSGTLLQLVHPVSTKITDGEFSVNDLSIAGQKGVASLNIKGRPSSLEGTVSGALDLGIIEFLTSAISKATGSADLDFKIGGILKAPTIFGTADIDDGSVRMPAVDSPFENLTGSLQLRQNILTVQNLEADLGGGRIRVGGAVTLFPNKYPALALKADLSGTRFRIYPFQYVKLSGNLGVNGEERPYLVDGSLVIDSAMSKENILGRKDEQGLKTLQYTPLNTSQGDLDVPLVKLKIDVLADHNVFVKNDLFDLEMKAKLTLVNTLDAPRIIGTADMVQGKMTFKGRVFQIQSFNAVFDNPNVINPQFNLTGTTDVSNTKVQLYASGRVSKWKLDLTSNPAMAESEILSLLAIGNSATSSKFANLGVNNTTAQQGEAAELVLESLDFNREVQEKTGLQFQLDEYSNTLQGQSVFSRSVTETVSPKIIVKKKLGDKVTLSYGSTVGVDTNRSTEASAEYSLTPGLSVLGIWDTYEFEDLEQRMDSQSSYGFDLKLQKRFK